MLIFRLILGSIVLAVGAAQCQEHWVGNDGSCYLFIDENVVWTSALVMCRTLFGADMLEIGSEAENNYIVAQMADQVGIQNVWLGLTDLIEEGSWTLSSNNEPPEYTNWAAGEPNNDNRNEGGQDCAYIRTSDGRWDDDGCDKGAVVHAVVCENNSGHRLVG